MFIKYFDVFNESKDSENNNNSQDIFKFLRKEPKFIKQFSEFSADIPIHQLENLYDRMVKHRNTLKQNKVDLTKLDTVEQITDKLDEMTLIEKANKFLKLVPNPFRSEIKNTPENYKKFKSIVLELDFDLYKSGFMSKVASLKDNDLSAFFKSFENYMVSMTAQMKETFDDINNTEGIDLIFRDKETLIAMVYSHKASIEMGSTQWCISYTSSTNFDNYIGKRRGVQYFIWDFSKEQFNSNSKLGITIYPDSTYDAHDKVDDKVVIKDIPHNKIFKNISNILPKQILKYAKYNKSLRTEYTLLADVLNGGKDREYAYNVMPSLIFYLTNKDDIKNIGEDVIIRAAMEDSDRFIKSHIFKIVNDDLKIKLLTISRELYLEYKEEYDNRLYNLMGALDKVKIIRHDSSNYNYKDHSTEANIEVIKHVPEILCFEKNTDIFYDKKIYNPIREYFKDRELLDTERFRVQSQGIVNLHTPINVVFKYLSYSDEAISNYDKYYKYIYLSDNDVIESDFIYKSLFNTPDELVTIYTMSKMLGIDIYKVSIPKSKEGFKEMDISKDVIVNDKELLAYITSNSIKMDI